MVDFVSSSVKRCSVVPQVNLKRGKELVKLVTLGGDFGGRIS